jgi:hypothetical protein
MTEDRPPFVLQRAHGVAPGSDGIKADADYKLNQPRRQIRPVPSDKPAAHPPPVKEQPTVPPHQVVLADLKEQKKLIDTAIAAIEALYQ